MRVALDSNRYRDFTEDKSDVVQLLEAAEEVWLPLIVLAELRAGYSLGIRGRANEIHLQRFLAKPGVGVLFPRETTTHAYSSLYRQLRQQGTPIPSSCLWIAALVVEHGLTLCTRDAHFLHLPQIDRI